AAACIAIAYLTPPGLANTLAVPFFKNLLFAFGWFFVPFGAIVIVGASNAVNLTDGLDGLAIVPSMIAAGCFAVIAYLAGNLVFANYLQIVQVASYKMTGRRVFRMAPLHHHFEQMGWEEPKIVIRFWIIAWILAIAGLATLKLR